MPARQRAFRCPREVAPPEFDGVPPVQRQVGPEREAAKLILASRVDRLDGVVGMDQAQGAFEVADDCRPRIRRDRTRRR